MKSFSQFISESKKDIVITFCTFNPPTVEHEQLLERVASEATGNNYRIFVSPTKSTLLYEERVKESRKMFSKHGRQIISDESVKSIRHALAVVYEQGYTDVTVVVPKDQAMITKAIIKGHNGVKVNEHGFYNFEHGVRVIAADVRDTTKMSAKLCEAAVANDFQAFTRGLPSSYKESQKLFNMVRTGLGLKESYDFRKHVKLATVSEQREAYVEGELFAEKSKVIIKETSEVATVAVRGANYIIVESADGKRYRKWLTDVEPLN